MIRANIVLLICMTTLVLACKKKEKEKYMNVTGKIITAIDSITPLSNTSFAMYQWRLSGGGTAQIRTPYSQIFTTDDNGDFSVRFELENSGEAIAIDWPSNSERNDYVYKLAFVSFGIQESIDLGNVYADTLK